MIKKGDILEEIHVEDFAAESKCVAKIDGQVIFIEKTAPGDLVDIRIVRKKKNYLEATPLYFHKFSDIRQTPFCAHYGVCGGCKWQHIQYVNQLEFKQQQVLDQLKRIGHITVADHEPISGAAHQVAYRNKLEFTFTRQRWLTWEEIQSGEDFERRGLGFHLPGQFDKVLDIHQCYLQPDLSNRIRLKVKEIAIRENIPFFDLKTHEGFLRNLIIRNTNTGDWMVILQVKERKMDWIDKILQEIATSFPEIKCIYFIVNPKKNESYQDLEAIHHSGEKYIIEKLEDLTFRIGPKSFFQTNSLQALELYRTVREFGAFDGSEVVYDLYSGTGSIALFIARIVREVIGLEYVKEAVADAELNAEMNNIRNCRFIEGDMARSLNESLFREMGHPDVVITDPPRAGMHKDVIGALLVSGARKIIYVSCNPATQARDLELLKEEYKVVKTRAVDMFPHTQHIENIALLEKINNGSG